MKIAITVWGNRVSPVFDAASTLFIAEVRNRAILKKNYAAFNPAVPADLLSLLKKKGISILICGAISTKSAELLVENDIKLISFVTGNALKILDDFASKQTIEKTFMMPGCSRQYCWHNIPGKFHLGT